MTAELEFERQGNKNKLTPDHRQKKLDAVTARENAEYFATLVENTQAAENDYDSAVSSYVEVEDTREEVDLAALNAEMEQIVVRQSKLRTEIGAIVADLEGAS